MGRLRDEAPLLGGAGSKPALPSSLRRGALVVVAGASALVVLLAVTLMGHLTTTQLLEDSWATNMRGDAGGPWSDTRAFNPRVKSMDDVNNVVASADRWLQKREAMLQSAGGANKMALRARTLQLSEGDMDEFLVSDFFEYLSRNCCRSLYFPKEAQKALPQDLPGGVNGEFAQRLRDYVGMRNSLVFNGADADTAAFINTYFGMNLKLTDVISGFQMRKSYEIAGDHSSPLAYPEKLEEQLPQKLYQEDGMSAVDTSSMPPATAVIFNNFPRSPTGSPMFIMKFCQIENPYVQDGTRITVSPPDCAKAAKDLGSECSCGKIAFVGWDWDKAADNIWDTSSINAQVLAEYMGAGGKLNEMKSAPPNALAKAHSPARPTSHSAPTTRTQAKARAPAAGAGDLSSDNRVPYTPLTQKDHYTMNVASKTNRLAFAGRDNSNKVPATVVDRQPAGPPTWGVDSMNRDVIPEWEKQDDRYSFWGREGGWRNICGPRQHPMWDPQQKQFYTMKEGQASNYVKHWCTCMPSGNIEIETKQGVDTMGCEGMYEAGSNMKSVSVSPSGDARRMGRGADVYETTAPGYKYQRVMDRHDDLRWDERYPSFVGGNGGDRGIWMDENDAGPPPIIDDYAKGKLWAPKRQELVVPAEDQGKLPLNARENFYNDPANMVLPWDQPQASQVRQQQRGYVKARSTARSSLGMWADDVDILNDVKFVTPSSRKRSSRQQKVIVDAWGHPLTHRPTSDDYPMGSGDYESEIPPAPKGYKRENEAGLAIPKDATAKKGVAQAPAQAEETLEGGDEAHAATGGNVNTAVDADDVIKGDTPLDAAEEEEEDTPADDAAGLGNAEVVGAQEKAKAAAFRSAADAADTVAEAAKEHVQGKLLRKLEATAASSASAANALAVSFDTASTQKKSSIVHLNPAGLGRRHTTETGEAKPVVQPSGIVHLNPPGHRRTTATGAAKHVSHETHIVHLNPPGKRSTDASGHSKTAVLPPPHAVLPPSPTVAPASPASGVKGQVVADPNLTVQEPSRNAERKLPWREGTRDFHNHMNGRVHPSNPHPAEQVDIRQDSIKTSERHTPFTGWGLQRDRFGRATEIGYGGGFHGGGHLPIVDSRTLPMGGTAARPWKASVDDAAPPSPRIWSWQGVTDPHEDAIDMRRHRRRNSFPDTPGQGWDASTEANWREQDPEEQDYTWQLGRGLGGRDEDPEDDEALGVH